MVNPHVQRIAAEHSYSAGMDQAAVPRKRVLPSWLNTTSDEVYPTPEIVKVSCDGVLNYSCAVLNDGLLIMELRDAIREGDGERIARCWKLMLLYFKSARRYKYSLEAFYITAMREGIVSPRLHHDLLWSRVINSRGGAGHNVPADLHMEHLNRTLKDIIRGMGANVSEANHYTGR